jgi:hypothetical protein
MEGPLRDFRTGTGGAYAPLSEILPSARVARFVRMTKVPTLLTVQDDKPGSCASVRMTKSLAMLAAFRMA